MEEDYAVSTKVKAAEAKKLEVLKAEISLIKNQIREEEDWARHGFKAAEPKSRSQ